MSFGHILLHSKSYNFKILSIKLSWIIYGCSFLKPQIGFWAFFISNLTVFQMTNLVIMFDQNCLLWRHLNFSSV